jgi:hypothetical protein
LGSGLASKRQAGEWGGVEEEQEEEESGKKKNLIAFFQIL